MPVNCYIVQHRVEPGIDVVDVAGGEYNIAAIVAVLECFHNHGHVICCIRLSGMDSARSASVAATVRDGLCTGRT